MWPVTAIAVRKDVRSRAPAESPSGSVLPSRMRSTILPPSTAKARCATVSPTADAITALTASCVSWFSPLAVLACCSRVATSARSWRAENPLVPH